MQAHRLWDLLGGVCNLGHLLGTLVYFPVSTAHRNRKEPKFTFCVVVSYAACGEVSHLSVAYNYCCLLRDLFQCLIFFIQFCFQREVNVGRKVRRKKSIDACS